MTSSIDLHNQTSGQISLMSSSSEPLNINDLPIEMAEIIFKYAIRAQVFGEHSPIPTVCKGWYCVSIRIMRLQRSVFRIWQPIQQRIWNIVRIQIQANAEQESISPSHTLIWQNEQLWKIANELAANSEPNISLQEKKQRCMQIWKNTRNNGEPIMPSLLLRNPEITEAIQKLYLDQMELQILPPEIGNFYKLLQLSLSCNSLWKLPKSFQNLTALQELDLSSNEFETFPKEIYALSQLTYLSMAKNKLTTLPIAPQNLSKITTLMLQNNQLTSIPPEFMENLPQLAFLQLDHNQLSSLPPTIQCLTKLEILSLYDNRLTTLPKTIGTLIHLVKLNLKANPWETLPEELGQLALASFELELNMQSKLSPETRAKLRKNKAWLPSSTNTINLPRPDENFFNEDHSSTRMEEEE